MAFVNATDSSATSLPTQVTLGPQNFQDLFSSPFNVGAGNSSAATKTASATQAVTPSQSNPTSSNPLGSAFQPYTAPDALLPKSSGISNTMLLAGAGVLVLGIAVFMLTRKRH